MNRLTGTLSACRLAVVLDALVAGAIPVPRLPSPDSPVCNPRDGYSLVLVSVHFPEGLGGRCGGRWRWRVYLSVLWVWWDVLRCEDMYQHTRAEIHRVLAAVVPGKQVCECTSGTSSTYYRHVVHKVHVRHE